MEGVYRRHRGVSILTKKKVRKKKTAIETRRNAEEILDEIGLRMFRAAMKLDRKRRQGYIQ